MKNIHTTLAIKECWTSLQLANIMTQSRNWCQFWLTVHVV